MASTFEKETRVDPRGEAEFEAVLDPSWRVFAGLNGGYVTAAMLRALRRDFADSGPLRSLDARFLEPADPGPARISTHSVRDGGSVDVASARLSQQGEQRVHLAATFGRAGEGPSFVADEPPKVPSFDGGRELPAVGELEAPTFTQHVDFRVVDGDPPLHGSAGGDMQVWMRMAEPTAFDEPLVVFLADAWMAATMTVLDEPRAVPSLDISLQVHQLPDLEPTDPVLGVFKAEHGKDGYAFEDGTLWTPDGELVARARQTRRVLR